MTEKISFRDKFIRFCDRINTPFVQKVGNKLISKKHLYPSFFFPIIILMVIYAAIGIYPLGERSVLTLDMGAQYMFYFEQIRDVLTGEASLIYTFERSLGGEFLGYYGYYLASPLSWIVCLFPEQMIVEAVTFIMILKCGLSGLFFAYYIEKTRNTKDTVGLVMFSTMYALCAYAMTYQSNTMWMDALMLLPLVTLGLERLLTDGRFTLFIAAFALTVWSNFYIGYMCCFYVLFYTICFLCAHDDKEINPLCEVRHKLKGVLRVGICSAVSLLICSFVIFTSYYALSFGKTDFQDTEFTFDLRFGLLELFSKFFLGSYDTIRPDGTPNVYSGILMLFMIPTYLVSKKFSGRHKIAYTSLCALFLASFSINAIDLVWHGFQMPVWLNYRYSFMLTFILLTMAYRGYESLAETGSKFHFQTGAFLVLSLMVMENTLTFTRYTNGVAEEVMPSFEFVWLSILFIGLYVAALYYAKHPKAGVKSASTFLLVVALMDACAGAAVGWGHEIYEVGYGKRSTYVEFLDKMQPAVDEIKESDDSFYRMEKNPYKKNNENLALNINGIASSTSTLNANVITLLYNMGFAANSHWAKYFSGNEVADSLLGIKYVISEEGNPVSSLYSCSTAENGLQIYKNPYALSIGYGASIKAKDLLLSQTKRISPFIYLDGMISTLSGSSRNLEIFEACEYELSNTVNCKKSTSGSSIRLTPTNPERKSSFVYTVTAKKSGSVYMNLLYTGSEKATYYVNGEQMGTVLETDADRIHNIGYFKAGETITVKFEFQTGTVCYESSPKMFAQVNETRLASAISYLSEGNLNVTDYSSTRIEGTIKLSENQFVFTTIPYDKYWKVYVDGERVETFSTMDTLLSFDASAGEHEIKMVYVSTPFYLGLGATLSGIMLFACLILLERKKGIRIFPVKKIPSAEGDPYDGSSNTESAENTEVLLTDTADTEILYEQSPVNNSNEETQ